MAKSINFGIANLAVTKKEADEGIKTEQTAWAITGVPNKVLAVQDKKHKNDEDVREIDVENGQPEQFKQQTITITMGSQDIGALTANVCTQSHLTMIAGSLERMCPSIWLAICQRPQCKSCEGVGNTKQ